MFSKCIAKKTETAFPFFDFRENIYIIYFRSFINKNGVSFLKLKFLGSEGSDYVNRRIR